MFDFQKFHFSLEIGAYATVLCLEFRLHDDRRLKSVGDTRQAIFCGFCFTESKV